MFRRVSAVAATVSAGWLLGFLAWSCAKQSSLPFLVLYAGLSALPTAMWGLLFVAGNRRAAFVGVVVLGVVLSVLLLPQTGMSRQRRLESIIADPVGTFPANLTSVCILVLTVPLLIGERFEKRGKSDQIAAVSDPQAGS
ncbi:MAG: hypothetical protein KF774_17620 [Planctomyces sp.]|nr:hypothetical protein [Planctomyces sp.]